jgi:YggT family protein
VNMAIISGIVSIIFRLLTVIVVVDVIVSYFLPPFNNFRIVLDRVVSPMLNPIRKIIPPVQMIDFSPIILLVILQMVEYIIVQLLRSFG